MRNYKKITILFVLLFSIFLLTTSVISASDTDDMNTTQGDVQTVHVADKTSSIELDDNSEKVGSENTNKKINKQVSDTKEDTKSDTKKVISQDTKKIQLNKNNSKATTNSVKSLKTQEETVNDYSSLRNQISNFSPTDDNYNLTINLDKGDYYIYDGGTITLTNKTYFNLTINGNGHTINGQGNEFLNISNGFNVTLNNIVITNSSTAILNDGCLSIVNSSFDNGFDGIFNAGNLTIKCSNFVNFSGNFVIYNAEYSNLSVINTNFINNSDISIGNYGNLGIRDSNFINNSKSVFFSYSNINLSVINTSFINNSNGAIDHSVGNLTIINSTFIHNTKTYSSSHARGGAVYSTGNLIVNDSIFINNTATRDSYNYGVYAYGGAIWCKNATLNNVTFNNNGAYDYNKMSYGGAIYSNGYLYVNNSKFINNKASYGNRWNYQVNTYGGAIYSSGYGANNYYGHGITVINNTIFNSNRAIASYGYSYGGAVYQNTGSLIVNNCNFTDNSASTTGTATVTYGGAIWGNNYNSTCNLLINNSNFMGGNATQGGAIYSPYSGNLTIENSNFTDVVADDETIYIGSVANKQIKNNNYTNCSIGVTATITSNKEEGIIDTDDEVTITTTQLTVNNPQFYDEDLLTRYGTDIYVNNEAVAEVDGNPYTITPEAGDLYVFIKPEFTNQISNTFLYDVELDNLENTVIIVTPRIITDVNNITTVYTNNYTIVSTANHTTPITVAVTNKTGSLVTDGGVVSVYNGNTLLGSNKTVDGVATIELSPLDGVDLYNITVCYNATSKYNNQTNITSIQTLADDLYVNLNELDVKEGTESNPTSWFDALSRIGNNGTIHIVYGNDGVYNIPDLNYRLNLLNGLTFSSAYETVYEFNIVADKPITLNGDNLETIISISNMYDITMVNITFANGNSSYGGAIQNYGTLTLINTTFVNNTAPDLVDSYNNTIWGYGGAIYNDGNLIIKNSTFINNTAGSLNTSYAMGGAIYSEINGNNYVIINNTIFRNNSADLGGAIYNKAILHINNTDLINNTAINGGSIWNNYYAYIYNTNFTSNKGVHAEGNESVIGFGGAIYTTQYLKVVNSTFTSNDASVGGAIYNTYITLVDDSYFTKNLAVEFGGAIYTEIVLNVTNSTFTFNNATYGGAINNVGNLTVNVSSFINNTAYDGGAINNLLGITYQYGTYYYKQIEDLDQEIAMKESLEHTLQETESRYSSSNLLESQKSLSTFAMVDSITVLETIHNNRINILGSIFINNTAEHDGGAIHNSLRVIGNGTIPIDIEQEFTVKVNAEDFRLKYETDLEVRVEEEVRRTIIVDRIGYYMVSLEDEILIYNTSFVNNTAGNDGGVVYHNISVPENATYYDLYETLLTVIQCNFTNNTAVRDGGVVWTNHESELWENVYSYNNATQGGTIFNNGTILVMDSVFNYNNATVGSTVFNNGTITIRSNEFNNNFATVQGGVLYTNDNSTTVFRDNLLVNNTITSPTGFIIYNSGSKITISNNDFINNTNSTLDDILFLHDENGINENITANRNIYLENSLYTLNLKADDQVVDLDDVKFNVTLDMYEVYNDVVKTGNITVYINGVRYDKELFEIVDGLTTIVLPNDEFAHVENNVTLVYTSADISYQPINTTIKVTVGKYPTTINITTPSDMKINNTYPVKIILFDTVNNELLANQNVTITVGDKTVLAVTDDEGSVIYNYTAVDNSEISVVYDGYERYEETSSNAPLTVIPTKTTILVDNIEPTLINKTVEIPVTLVDEDGNPIANQNITININGTTVTKETNTTGSVIFNYTPQTEGVYTVNITYNGTTVYTASNDTKQIIANPIDTIITIDPVPTVRVNEEVLINITLTDVDGNILSNKPVNLTIGNFTVITNTDENGIIRQNYTSNKEAIIGIVAIYEGDNIYNQTVNTTIFNIEKIGTTINNITTTNTKDNTLVSFILKDEYGNILPNAEIIIKNESGIAISSGVTDENGNLTVMLDVPDSLTNIVIVYNGNDTYKPTTETTQISPDKLKTTTVISNDYEVKVNQTTTITVTLTDEYGRLLANKVLNFTIGNVSVNLTTDNYGVARYTYTPQRGTIENMSARFDGDDRYYPSNDKSNMIVNKINTTVTIEALDIIKVNEVNPINITLKDEYGNILDNQVVNVTVADYNNNSTTDADGMIHYDYSSITEAIISIVAEYDGSDVYNYSVAVDNVVVERINTTIVDVKQINNIINNTSLNVTLVDEYNNPIPNAEVIIKNGDNEAITSGVTDENGTVNIPINLPEGQHPVVIEYNGNETYKPTNATAIVNIEKIPTFIVIDHVDQTKINHTAGVSVTLKDVYGNVLGDKVLNFTLDDVSLNLTTDSNGVIGYDYTPHTGGIKNITATFIGDDTYYGSNNNSLIIVNKINTTVSIEASDIINVNEVNPINITLKDEYGNILPFKHVNITIGDHNNVYTTDENGVIRYDYTSSKEAVVNIIALFEEDDVYNYSVDTNTFIVEKIATSIVDVEQLNKTIGHANLNMTLIDEYGNIIPDAEVIVKNSNDTAIYSGYTDKDGKLNVLLDTLPAGNHTIKLEYNGNDTYKPTNTTTTVEITGINPDKVKLNTTTLIRNDYEVKVNQTTVITVTLIDENDRLLANKVLNFTIGNVSVNLTTDNYGVARYTYTPQRGTIENMSARFDGDENYYGSNNNSLIIVNKINTTVTIETLDIIKVNEVNPINITLKDEYGNVLGNQVVNVTVADYNNNSTTDVEGTIHYDYSSITEAIISIVAEYDGSDVYNYSVAVDNVVVERINTTIVDVKQINNIINNTSLNVTLVDEYNNPIPNAEVIIKNGDNGAITSGVTDENGTVNIPINLPEGQHPVVIEYNGNETYKPSNTTAIIDIQKIPTYIVIDHVDQTKINHTTTITVTLKDVYGNVLGDKVLNFTLDGVSLNLTTDSNGVIGYNYTPRTGGIKNITATFAGDDSYYGSNNNSLIIVNKINTTVTIESNSPIKVDTTNPINITLKDEYGNILPFKQVNITIGDYNNVYITDENGVIKYDYTLSKEAVVNIIALFEEDEVYNYSVDTNTFIVEKIATSIIDVEQLNKTIGHANLNMTLIDEYGNSIPYTEVIVKNSNDTAIYSGYTDKDGKLNIPLDTLPAGNHTIKLEYNGNDTYIPTNTTPTVEILKKPVIIDTTVLDETIGNSTIQIVVTDPIDNKPVPEDTKVIVTLPDGANITTKTDANGTIIVDIPTNADGTFPLNITVPETPVYYNGTDNTTLNLNKLNVKVTLHDYEMYVLDFANITANITDENGNPINGGYIIFKVNGKTLQANGGFTTRSSTPMKINVVNGKANIVFNATSFYHADGINNIIVKYSGTSKYNQNASDVQVLKIKKRLAYLVVTTDKPSYILYEKVNITATYYDITHGTPTSIYADNGCYSIYKNNGLTSEVNGSDERFDIINSTTNIYNSATNYNYIDMSAINPGPNTVNTTYTVKMHNRYYEPVGNYTTIKIGQTPITFNNTNVIYNTTSHTVTVTTEIRDYKGNLTTGLNRYCVKVNGVTYYGNSTGGHIFDAYNGKISITLQNITVPTAKNVEVVTADRWAYTSARQTTTNIQTVN